MTIVSRLYTRSRGRAGLSTRRAAARAPAAVERSLIARWMASTNASGIPLVALVGPLRADVVEDDRVEAALKGGKGGRKRDLGVVLVVHNVRVDKYH